MSAPIVVIGAGFGGLAAAIRLRARGHEVLVLEAIDQAGGRARRGDVWRGRAVVPPLMRVRVCFRALLSVESPLAPAGSMAAFRSVGPIGGGGR